MRTTRLAAVASAALLMNGGITGCGATSEAPSASTAVVASTSAEVTMPLEFRKVPPAAFVGVPQATTEENDELQLVGTMWDAVDPKLTEDLPTTMQWERFHPPPKSIFITTSFEPLSVRIHGFRSVNADGIPSDNPDEIYKCRSRELEERSADCTLGKEQDRIRIDVSGVTTEYVTIQAMWIVPGEEKVAASWAYSQ